MKLAFKRKSTNLPCHTSFLLKEYEFISWVSKTKYIFDKIIEINSHEK